MRGPKLQFEHPTQSAASAFLLAAADGDVSTMWSGLSRETRGLLEGLYAARAGVSLRIAAGVESGGADVRLGEVVAPLRATILGALGVERIGGYGVANARLVERGVAYVLLLPDFGEERVDRNEPKARRELHRAGARKEQDVLHQAEQSTRLAKDRRRQPARAPHHG